MRDRLIILHRKYPDIYEVHRYEINRDKNIVFTTPDREFAESVVDSYNWFKDDDELDEWPESFQETPEVW